MRTLVIYLLVIMSVVATSCQKDDDNYSLGKFWVGFGVVDKTGSESITIQMDDGSVLFPVAGHTHGNWYEDEGRVLVNYTILDDKQVNEEVKEYYVKINSLRKILKKGILEITPAIEDSIGNDPLVMKHAWISSNQLLNFELRYYGNSGIHFINLVKQPGEISADDQPVELELRHNKNNDLESYLFNAFVSFDLSAIQISGQDSVRFVVKSKDYHGTLKTFEGTYRYGTN
jgi:hypothetical protein